MALDALDNYSGSITAIATIFLVIATVFLVRATLQLANITKNQDKPWLYFYPVETESQVYGNPSPRNHDLYVKNIGKGGARDIRFGIYLDDQSSPIKETNPDETFSLSPGEKFRIMKLPNPHGNVSIENICYLNINEEEIVQDDVPITFS
ncbi:Uncharacterised protein [uncultured archaeon]|nr:Uncharacterised protein [uncultured archaeon]